MSLFSDFNLVWLERSLLGLALPKLQLIMAQAQPSSRKDSLIAYGAEHLIDFGVVLLVFTIVIIIGIISKRLEHAILFALGLSAFLAVILWNL